MRGPPTVAAVVSELFDASAWEQVAGFDFTDITYHRCVRPGPERGTVRIAFDRPEVRNAFRPHTVDELYRALDHARMTPDVGCVLLTGNGPSPKDGGWAFCSGGDQRIRGRSGYQYAAGETADSVDAARVAATAAGCTSWRCSGSSATMPKIVVAVVPGWAAGGGHSLHVICDLTVARASTRASSRRTPTSPRSTAGSGRRTWRGWSARSSRGRSSSSAATYDAETMQRMGAVNIVAPHARSRRRRSRWRRRSTARARPRSGC